MLINCPRCGFSQPKDQYCAQCGVDILNYKPHKKSLSKKIFGSPVVQISFILSIALLAGIYFYQQNNSSIEARVNYLKGIQISASKTHTPASADTATNENTNNNAEEGKAASDKNVEELASAKVPDNKNFLGNSKNTASEKNDTNDGKNTATKNNSPSIKVYYAEISKAGLATLFDEAQASGQFLNFKDYSAGIAPHVLQKIQSMGLKILHKEEYNLTVGKNLQWFYGLRDRTDPDVRIGMTTFIEMSEGDGSSFKGNLEIQRIWREQSPAGLQKKSFPATFEVGPQSGFFMAGIMPIKSNLENDDELTSIDIYKILKSEDFIKGESEFVIFIELGNTPQK